MLDTLVVTIIRLVLKLTVSGLLPYDFSDTSPPGSDYDFIVIGAGAGGSVVASRLSETDAKVLLLEAGPPAPPEAAAPGLAPLMFGTEYDWKIKGKAQANSQLGYEGNASKIISGKLMGGTTSLNGLLYLRGNKKDYDSWAEQGNTGWDFDSVLPYFKKVENYKGFSFPNSDKYHGFSGPVSVEKRRVNSQLYPAMKEAAAELGFNLVDDLAPSPIGFIPYHASSKEGVRASASESYLKPVVNRKNLHILTSARVKKIIFNDNKEAVGVEYLDETGASFAVRASKEIIISAGGFFSPQLLMLSGVGPADQLNKFNIPIVQELPGVGRNLQDHPNVYLSWLVKKGTSTSLFDILNPINFFQYAKDQTGELSVIAGAEMNGFFNLNGDDAEWADTQIYMTSVSFALDGGTSIASALGVKDDVFKDVYGPFIAQETLSLSPIVSRPKSRGSVTLAADNIHAPPIVDLNYFGDESDLDLMVKAIRFAQKIGNTYAVKRILGARNKSNTLRYCSQHPDNSDDYWKCYVRYMVNSLWHPSGSCKMSPDSDAMGVVDNRLRVRGVSKLRVVDASVMPTIPSCNVQAPVYMVGERASDLIKEDNGYPFTPPT